MLKFALSGIRRRLINPQRRDSMLALADGVEISELRGGGHVELQRILFVELNPSQPLPVERLPSLAPIDGDRRLKDLDSPIRTYRISACNYSPDSHPCGSQALKVARPRSEDADWACCRTVCLGSNACDLWKFPRAGLSPLYLPDKDSFPFGTVNWKRNQKMSRLPNRQLPQVTRCAKDAAENP